MTPLWDNSTVLPDGTDLDLVRRSGFYVAKSALDAPEPGEFHVLVLNANSDGFRRTYQILWSISSGIEYFRTADNAGFGEWASRAVGGEGGGDISASIVLFNNTLSGLTATRVQGAIDELDGLLDTAITDIGDLQTAVTGILSSISALEGSVTSLGDRTSALETDVGNLQIAVGDNTTNIGTLQSGVEDHETRLDALEPRVTAAEGAITTLDGRLDTVETTLGGVPAAIAAAVTDHEEEADPHPQYLTAAEVVGAIDTELGSEDWKGGGAGGPVAAEDVSFDNTATGLVATDVQAALAELDARPGGGASAAEDVTYDNVTSGLTATDAQAAIDELAAHTHATATTSEPGFLSATDKTKLDGIEAGATGDLTGAEIEALLDTEIGHTGWKEVTDLGFSRTATTVTVISSTGDDAELPAANTSNAGVLSAADKTKLDSVESGAEVNQTGAEIVTAINAQLGSTEWQGAGGGDESTNATVRVVATANVTLADLEPGFTIDDVVLAEGYLVLLTEQTAPEQNGIYLVGELSSARPASFDSFGELAGTIVTVQSGTTYGGSIWLCTSVDSGTIDTDPLVFERTSIAPTNLASTRNSTEVFVHSSTGNSAVLPAATTTEAGVMTAADKVKLDGLGTGETDLTFSRDATTVTVESSTGDDVALPAATTIAAGVMSADDKTKLNGIEANATADMTGAEIVSAINGALGSSVWQEGGGSGGGGGDATDITIARDGSTVTVASSSGGDGVIGAADGSNAGVMTAAMFTKLSGIAAGAQVNVPTNLTFSRNGTTLTVASDTGSDAVLPAADGSNAGLLSAADKVILDGVYNGKRRINPQTGTSYTLLTSDPGKLVTLSNAAPITLTVPTHATAAIAVESQIDFAQIGAGVVTVTPAVGVTLISAVGLKTAGQGAAGGMVKLAENTWLVFGTLVVA